mmetsp:Transcript_25086/g.62950  ORF Transcript_25086/g.62950 Transcript_25086/m.62950 type:complete len:215 (+) Transcript_25086:846-1490(+)
MSRMRPLTFAKGSSPAELARRIAEAMRRESCMSSSEFSFSASFRTKRTASKFARSEDVLNTACSEFSASCRKLVWPRLYVMSDAPPACSEITFFASLIAFNSSARLFISASKSWDFVMQSWWSVLWVDSSACNSFDVAPKSPSAVALASCCAAKPFRAASKSALANLISSLSDCFNISKLCRLFISFFRASSSSSLALSKRPSNVSTIEPLWLL